MSKTITLAEVNEHKSAKDLWVVIDNQVYDLTKFLYEHPGGEDSLISVGGRDGTREFNEVGHSQEAREIMKKFLVGNLAASDIKKKPPVGATPTDTIDTDANANASNEPAAPKQCCILN
ncbi:cytochrome b5 isoform X2 [Drosophila grimshawi]|uniref:cytochrome b5 isoform X2 n=1 Tax=Drosophila grimshawi TaxID=7222 RepID=UPI000C870695|nr:cytochrome b5 isoform X2 [Drosophila grimshawi]